MSLVVQMTSLALSPLQQSRNLPCRGLRWSGVLLGRPPPDRDGVRDERQSQLVGHVSDCLGKDLLGVNTPSVVAGRPDACLGKPRVQHCAIGVTGRGHDAKGEEDRRKCKQHVHGLLDRFQPLRPDLPTAQRLSDRARRGYAPQRRRSRPRHGRAGGLRPDAVRSPGRRRGSGSRAGLRRGGRSRAGPG